MCYLMKNTLEEKLGTPFGQSNLLRKMTNMTILAIEDF